MYLYMVKGASGLQPPPHINALCRDDTVKQTKHHLMSIYSTVSSRGLVYEAYHQQPLWDQHAAAMEVQTHGIFGMKCVSIPSHILQRKVSYLL
jgi:hypothetical protein